MARVLILTYPHDIHAVVVSLALGDLGHDAVLWHGADFPTRQHASMDISQHGMSWQLSGLELGLSFEQPFDVVWYRRPTLPVLPEDLHPGDRPPAQRECDEFVTALWHLVAPDAFHVNPLASRIRARSKPIQLVDAVRAGFRIPPTLINNDPERIRRFIANQADGAVFKPFYPVEWHSGDATWRARKRPW